MIKRIIAGAGIIIGIFLISIIGTANPQLIPQPVEIKDTETGCSTLFYSERVYN